MFVPYIKTEHHLLKMQMVEVMLHYHEKYSRLQFEWFNFCILCTMLNTTEKIVSVGFICKKNNTFIQQGDKKLIKRDS